MAASVEPRFGSNENFEPITLDRVLEPTGEGIDTKYTATIFPYFRYIPNFSDFGTDIMLSDHSIQVARSQTTALSRGIASAVLEAANYQLSIPDPTLSFTEIKHTVEWSFTASRPDEYYVSAVRSMMEAQDLEGQPRKF